jgi:hypothetical protein
MFKNRKESGQALVEYALVLPLFIIVLCAIIDCAWIGYQYISFDYSYREASWELSVDDSDVSQSHSLSGSQAAKVIIENMKATALGIDQANLSVSNDAIIQLWSEIKTDQYPATQKGSYETKQNYWRYMQIKAELTYKIHPLTPVGRTLFGGTITYAKKLNKTRLKTIQNV